MNEEAFSVEETANDILLTRFESGRSCEKRERETILPNKAQIPAGIRIERENISSNKAQIPAGIRIVIDLLPPPDHIWRKSKLRRYTCCQSKFQSTMASSEPEEATRQGESHMFVILVDCHLTVEEGGRPFNVFKEAVEHIINIAGDEWQSTFTLGKLNGSGPYLSPENLPRTWSEAKKYIKVQGDERQLYILPRRKLSNLCITFGLAGKEPLDEDDIIYGIDFELMRRRIRYVNVKPGPALMIEVEANLNE